MGDSIIRNTESSWANFANYLTDAFKTQYGNRNDVLSFLTQKFQNMVTNPQGFDQATISALRGGSVDQVTRQFQSAKESVQNTMAGRGDLTSEVQSGVNKQIQGQLAGGQAAENASALNNVQRLDEEQKIQNQRIGLQGLEGVAAQENPAALAAEANGAAGTTGNLGSEYFGTDQSGFMDVMGRSLANGLGNVLSGGNAGKNQNSTSQVGGFFGA